MKSHQASARLGAADMRTERDTWILLAAQYPDQVPQWARCQNLTFNGQPRPSCSQAALAQQHPEPSVNVLDLIRRRIRTDRGDNWIPAGYRLLQQGPHCQRLS